MTVRREFPRGPLGRTLCFCCHGPGSIPGQGAKILQAVLGRDAWLWVGFLARGEELGRAGVATEVAAGAEAALHLLSGRLCSSLRWEPFRDGLRHSIPSRVPLLLEGSHINSFLIA